MEQSIYYWILDIGIMYRKGGGRSGFWRIGERKELLREVDFWLSVLDMIAEERKGIDCSKQFWKEFTALCKRGNCSNYQRILQKKEDISNCKDIFMPDKEHEAKIHQLLQYFCWRYKKVCTILTEKPVPINCCTEYIIFLRQCTENGY